MWTTNNNILTTICQARYNIIRQLLLHVFKQLTRRCSLVKGFMYNSYNNNYNYCDVLRTFRPTSSVEPVIPYKTVHVSIRLQFFVSSRGLKIPTILSVEFCDKAFLFLFFFFIVYLRRRVASRIIFGDKKSVSFVRFIRNQKPRHVTKMNYCEY